MQKIRTVEALDRAIDEETSWRLQELTTILRLVDQASGPAQRANLRASVLILYAHWEGWIKNVAQLYVRYVNTKAYSYEQLSTAFLGTALKTKLNEIQQSNSASQHREFASFVQSNLQKRAALSPNLVKTESNLSSTVFYDTLDRLGLPKRNEYISRQKMIDVELVHQRNTIAHGEFIDLNSSDFRTLRNGILEILSIFTDDVRNSASTEQHLLNP